MGGMEDYNRKQMQQPCSVRMKLKIVLLVVSTNLITFYFASGRGSTDGVTVVNPFVRWQQQPESELCGALLRQLNGTDGSAQELTRRLVTSNGLLEALIVELGRLQTTGGGTTAADDQEEIIDRRDGWREQLTDELKLAVGPHKLPLGFNPNIGSDEIYVPVGAGCRKYQDEVDQYMNYKVGGECPSDDMFAQRLMLKGCEPLPRRRCHPKSPVGYVEPRPISESLWGTPPDTSIVWDPYTCKNYDCLVNRAKIDPKPYDCKDCFDLLKGREKHRWIHDSDGLDYGIDSILAYKPNGTIRIGLDLGGGSGTFAARMRERGVTIVSTSMNFDGPFNSFIASRGLIPMHISISHRLPFFENTLDIVHSMHVLSNWIPDPVLEFTLFDIYRVLRPGGLFWLDHFFCIGPQLNATYVPLFNRVGFKKLRWHAGRKLDRGAEKNEWYISALLEKPMT